MDGCMTIEVRAVGTVAAGFYENCRRCKFRILFSS